MRSTALLRPVVVTIGLALAPLAGCLGGSVAALAQNQPPAAASDELQQVTLTDQMIENILAAKKDMDAALAKLPESASEQPDAKAMAALDAVAKKYKFANYGQYDDASSTIGVVMSGIDPETKAYVGPEAVIKKQIADVQADKSLKPKDRKDALDELNTELKGATPVKVPANIDLVVKHYDKLVAALSSDDQ